VSSPTVTNVDEHSRERSRGGDPSRAESWAVAHARRNRRKASWRLVALGVVLVGALSFLLVKGLAGSLDYFETVDQALAHKTMLGTRTFRLEGLVQPGTVRRTPSGVSFVAEGTHDKVAVTNTGNPPELFQPDIPVVVVGHFAGGVFVSDQIIVDHSAQYIQAHPQRVEAPNGTRR
jgi:cytochrome c-type biogenesis protein CcmE